MSGEQGIFPITDAEAAVLYDIGWSSGYGWKDSWDWWKNTTPSDKQMESRDWDETKRSFTLDLITIRVASKRSDEIISDYLTAGLGGAKIKWQPMSIAPLDGSEVLLKLIAHNGERVIVSGRYFTSPKELDDSWETEFGSHGDTFSNTVEAWAPLSEDDLKWINGSSQ